MDKVAGATIKHYYFHYVLHLVWRRKEVNGNCGIKVATIVCLTHSSFQQKKSEELKKNCFFSEIVHRLFVN